MTRQEVAATLGVSIATVRRLEGTKLRPIQDDRGRWHFDRREVEGLAAQRPARAERAHHDGELAAQVFLMLGEGRGLRHIVTTQRVAPEVVRKLYAEWVTDLNTGELARRADDAERRAEKQEREFARWQRELDAKS